MIPEVEVVRESKYEIGEEDESEVPGENKKEGEDSSVGYETKVESSIDLVDCPLPFFDDDTGIDVELSQPMTNWQFPPEFTFGDWQDEFNCTD